jgi:predicted transcriptional regulator
MVKTIKQKSSSLTLRIDPTLKKYLTKEAVETNRPVSYIVIQAMSEYLEQKKYEKDLIQILENASIESNETNWLSQTEVLNWMENWTSDTK